MIPILLVQSSSPVINANYTIEGNRVYINDSKTFINIEPHTIQDSQWVYVNLTSKVYTGDIDVAFGFNTTITKPSKAELYHPRTINWNETHSMKFKNITSISITTANCSIGNEYNNYKRKINYMQFTGFQINSSDEIWSNYEEIVCFDSFVNESSEYVITYHTAHSEDRIWLDVTNRFNSIDHTYQDVNKWYYVTDIPIIQDNNYQLRFYVDVPITMSVTSGKYYVAFKPSSETIQEAITNEHFYFIDPWWNVSCLKCQNVTYYGTGSTNHTEFPFLINATYDSDMQDMMQDIRILSEPCGEDGIELAYEFDNVTYQDRALIWVNLLNYSEQGDTISMYYGNAEAANGEDIPGTWNDNYTVVWHMADNTTGSVLDSTSNNIDGFKAGANAPSIATNWFGLSQSQYFTNDDITGIGTVVVGSSRTFTFEVWGEETSIGTSEYIMSLTGAFFRIGNEAKGDWIFGYDKEVGTGEWLQASVGPDNDLHYFTGVWDLSNVIFYVDAVSEDTSAELPENFTKYPTIGGDGDASGEWDGNIDEYRVSNVARSPDWINLTYANIMYNDIMVTFGAEESAPPPNYAPNATIPTIIPDPSYVGSKLNCSTTPTDIENVSLTVNFAWWYNGAVCDGCGYNVTVATTNNTPTYTTTLVTEALSKHDNWTCLVQANDGEDSSDWINSTIQISNTAPTFIQSIASITRYHNENVSIQFNVTDADSESVTYVDNTSLFNINATGHVFDNPTQAEHGNYSIQINVTDSEATISMNFTYEIINRNPTWSTPISNVTKTEDFIEFTHVADLDTLTTDSDDDTLLYSVVNENISQVDCNISGTELNITLAQNWNGYTNCTIQVNDSILVSNTIFYINVTAVNDVPTFDETITIISLTHNKNLSIQLNATDVEGNTIIWATNLTMISINQSGYVSDNPTMAESVQQNYSITINVTDDNSSATNISFTYQINNTAPVVTLVTPTDTSTENVEPIELNWTATDSENDNLTYFIYGGTTTTPTTLLNTTTLTHINWSSLVSNTNYYWKVTATDGYLNQTSSTFQFTFIQYGMSSTEHNWLEVIYNIINRWNLTNVIITINDSITTIKTRLDSLNETVNNINETVNTINSTVNSIEATQDLYFGDWNSTFVDFKTNFTQLSNFFQCSDTNKICDYLNGTNRTVYQMRSSQQKDYNIFLSDWGELLATEKYYVKLFIFDYEGQPMNAAERPNMTLYDPLLNIIATETAMTKEQTGIYSYDFTSTSGHDDGVWEALAKININGTDIQINDYWELETNPAEVTIEVTDTSIPTIGCRINITNEGSSNQEYQYRWWVTNETSGQYATAIDSGSAAKLLSAGESWDTTKELSLVEVGNYWCKAEVFYGTERSGASDGFIATRSEVSHGNPASFTDGIEQEIKRTIPFFNTKIGNIVFYLIMFVLILVILYTLFKITGMILIFLFKKKKKKKKR